MVAYPNYQICPPIFALLPKLSWFPELWVSLADFSGFTILINNCKHMQHFLMYLLYLLRTQLLQFPWYFCLHLPSFDHIIHWKHDLIQWKRETAVRINFRGVYRCNVELSEGSEWHSLIEYFQFRSFAPLRFWQVEM